MKPTMMKDQLLATICFLNFLYEYCILFSGSSGEKTLKCMLGKGSVDSWESFEDRLFSCYNNTILEDSLFLFLFHWKDRETDRTFHLLIYSSDTRISWSWAILKPES